MTYNNIFSKTKAYKINQDYDFFLWSSIIFKLLKYKEGRLREHR